MTDEARTPPDRSHRLSAPIWVGVILVLTLYIGGYFGLGNPWRPGPPGAANRLRMRVFGSAALAAVYQPAAWVESRVRGYSVTAGTEDDLFSASP